MLCSLMLRNLTLGLLLTAAASAQTPDAAWPIHSMDRPLPPVVTAQPNTAPSDAVILFDGHSLTGWQALDGGPAGWHAHDGILEVAPGTGSIETTQGFSDFQLHVEWSEPNELEPPVGDGQDSGNSGIILMGLYELQVLDNYHRRTYADGMAGSIYGQYPPLVNAARAPLEWQTYDIVFHRPRFHPDGSLLTPAIITVLQNGVLVQDSTRPTGPTAHLDRPSYIDLGDKLPIILQDHNAPVLFRNLWLRNIPPPAEPLNPTTAVPLSVSAETLAAYLGTYTLGNNTIEVAAAAHGLEAHLTHNAAGKPHTETWPLYLVDKDTFLVIKPVGGNPFHFEFVRGPNATLPTLVVRQSGRTSLYTRKP